MTAHPYRLFTRHAETDQCVSIIVDQRNQLVRRFTGRGAVRRAETYLDDLLTAYMAGRRSQTSAARM